jgi:hypothetical protein
MAKKSLIYETTSDFYLGGQYIPAGATVTHGHPLMKGRSHLFRPFVPTYDFAEEAEPEPAPKKAEAKAEPKAEPEPVKEESTEAEPDKAEG